MQNKSVTVAQGMTAIKRAYMDIINTMTELPPDVVRLFTQEDMQDDIGFARGAAGEAVKAGKFGDAARLLKVAQDGQKAHLATHGIATDTKELQANVNVRTSVLDLPLDADKIIDAAVQRGGKMIAAYEPPEEDEEE